MLRASILLAVSVIFFPLSAVAQAPGCGPANVRFDVQTKKAAAAAPSPESGKALLFFLQDDAKYNKAPRPTTRFAIDGVWVGATHANSYFYVAVDPGEHHLCANWQSAPTGLSWLGAKRSTSATHFTAEAGKSYYFRAQDILLTDADGKILQEPEVKLLPVDSDEAQVLMSSFSLSLSRQKN